MSRAQAPPRFRECEACRRGPNSRAVAPQALVSDRIFDDVQIDAKPHRCGAQHRQRCGRDFRAYPVAGERYKPHEENNCIRECAV